MQMRSRAGAWGAAALPWDVLGTEGLCQSRTAAWACVSLRKGRWSPSWLHTGTLQALPWKLVLQRWLTSGSATGVPGPRKRGLCIFSLQLKCGGVKLPGEEPGAGFSAALQGTGGCLPVQASTQIAPSASSCCSPGDPLSSWHPLAEWRVPGPPRQCQPQAPRDL